MENPVRRLLDMLRQLFKYDRPKRHRRSRHGCIWTIVRTDEAVSGDGDYDVVRIASTLR